MCKTMKDILSFNKAILKIISYQGYYLLVQSNNHILKLDKSYRFISSIRDTMWYLANCEPVSNREADNEAYDYTESMVCAVYFSGDFALYQTFKKEVIMMEEKEKNKKEYKIFKTPTGYKVITNHHTYLVQKVQPTKEGAINSYKGKVSFMEWDPVTHKNNFTKLSFPKDKYRYSDILSALSKYLSNKNDK